MWHVWFARNTYRQFFNLRHDRMHRARMADWQTFVPLRGMLSHDFRVNLPRRRWKIRFPLPPANPETRWGTFSRRFSLRYIVIISRQRVPLLVSLSSSSGHRRLNFASSKIFESIIPPSLYPTPPSSIVLLSEKESRFFNNKKMVKHRDLCPLLK